MPEAWHVPRSIPSMRLDNRLWFLVLCLFWGGTWLAVKVTVAEIPPMVVACVRALLAGASMAVIAGPERLRTLLAAAPVRSTIVALLTTTFAFSAMYWGTARLSTGVSAIVNNATMPIGLLVFGWAFREETISRRQIAGIALGVLGLVLLFARRSGGSLDTASIAGLVAMVAGTLSYCLGSVLARPLLRASTPMAVGALQLLGGGVAMLPLVWVLEQPTWTQVAALLSPVPLLGLLWMVTAGGVAGTFIYLRLIHDWGPTRAGMYAFVTPIIATALGAIVLHERLGVLEVAGAAILLTAAALVIPGRGRRARRGASVA